VPVLINPAGELTCGKSRLLFSFIDTQNRPVAKPDRTATLALYDLARDPAKPVSTTDATFVWAIEGSVGIYVAHVEFSEAGVWGAELSTTAGGKTDRNRVTFSVNPSTPMVGVGDKAPSVTTPTGDPARISTDAKPDPRFYKTSVDEALGKHQPFVLVFATPKFCTSGQCGPTLERVKPFLDKYPTMTFINVEPYELKPDAGGQLQPVMTSNQLTPTKATEAWGLLSEPWLYVVDRNGLVTASLGLIFSDQELSAAIEAVK
jgi:hypothetical protein